MGLERVFACVARVFYYCEHRADRIETRSKLPDMIETTPLTPPGAYCTCVKAHDKTDGFVAYEITVEGQTIELGPEGVEQLAHLLTEITRGH